jgi:trans-aconitate 2-methyltransferase
MPSWSPSQYLKFAQQRTRPCRDLAARLSLARVRRAIDLGCGPGNSTEVLAGRWPEADITGMDASPEMILAAREAQPGRRFVVGDIATWAEGTDGPDEDGMDAGGRFDLVFSNAALQWVGDHGTLFPRLLARAAEGGALAVQIPGNKDAPVHRRMREIAGLPAWRGRFGRAGVRAWHSHDPAFYYDLLAPLATRLDLWTTDYLHVLPDVEAIVEWYKGTGMRPYLDVLDGEADRERFAGEYLEAIRPLYPPRSDGRVLFPFRRLFLVAYRPPG